MGADLLDTCRIARPYLANTKKFTAPEVTEAPLIVFINSKSGGRVGPALTEVLYQSLGHAQVSRNLCFCLYIIASGDSVVLGAHAALSEEALIRSTLYQIGAVPVGFTELNSHSMVG